MKKATHTAIQKGEKYRSIFEHSSVSLWEEDISKLRSKLAELKKGRNFNLREHLTAHPEFVREAVGLIEVTDVNQATLGLFEADCKGQLLGPLTLVLDDVSRTSFSGMILAIDDGISDIESISAAVTITGKKLAVIVKSHIPHADAAYSHMIVSIIDITARKLAEERELESANILHSIIESAPDAIFVKDRSLRMVLCNSVHSRSIGKEPEDTYGKTDVENGWSAELVKGCPEKGIEGWEKNEMAALLGTTVQVSDMPTSGNDETRYFNLVKMPLRDRDGAVIGVIGIGLDVTKRKRAEDELRESEERYRSLYVDSRDAIMMLSPERGFLAGNPAAIKLFGCRDEQDFTIQTAASLSPEYQPDGVASSDRSLEMMRLALEKGSHLFEWTHRRMDGTDFPATVLLSRLEISGTRLLQATVHDITKQKQAEAALAWERNLFNMLMENLPDYIYFKDKMSRFIRTNTSHARVLGLRDPSEAVGKTDADFYSVDHAQKALEDEQRIISTGRPLVDVEECETHPDRPNTWVLTTKMTLRDPTGAILGTFGISHDITRRKQLELANQQLATLVESADDAIVGIDLDRRIAYWSKGAERLYGYTVEEMTGTATSTLIPPDLEEEARHMRERVIRGEQITHYETARLRKDGKRIIVSLTLSAIRNPEGSIVGMASTARDVTAQKALQAQLNRMQRLESLATLAGGVAHQFNNINTVVKGYLQLIQSEKSLPARLVSFVEAANSGVQKAVDITDSLLALTEPGGSLSALRLEVLARSLLPLYEKRIEEEKVHLVLDVGETPQVQGDESRLKFVLSSLINNALDSLLDQPAREVCVRSGNAKDGAYIEVQDSGCGIPEEDLARIFSPFFSGKGEWAPHGSPQARLKGVGLSLAISSTTVAEYGGRIDVQSIKGKGSTFRVLMPLADVMHGQIVEGAAAHRFGHTKA